MFPRCDVFPSPSAPFDLSFNTPSVHSKPSATYNPSFTPSVHSNNPLSVFFNPPMNPLHQTSINNASLIPSALPLHPQLVGRPSVHLLSLILRADHITLTALDFVPSCISHICGTKHDAWYICGETQHFSHAYPWHKVQRFSHT